MFHLLNAKGRVPRAVIGILSTVAGFVHWYPGLITLTVDLPVAAAVNNIRRQIPDIAGHAVLFFALQNSKEDLSCAEVNKFEHLLLFCVGIRLEKRFMQVGAQQVQVISTRVLGQQAIDLCKEGNCIGTMKKRSASKKSSHHWLPSIHEDYCGPRHHKSRYH
ncbi:hypothetical protein POTOM_056409 [Populus tomentosa]|uniref:Uncharacterized protein n=1 Tax=Populus tomentosa TaxID=118781 RepID=A0A8X7XV80_POPTO|nr:hypothetical protein POTOM_056409 [Populus tomentosa]